MRCHKPIYIKTILHMFNNTSICGRRLSEFIQAKLNLSSNYEKILHHSEVTSLRHSEVTLRHSDLVTSHCIEASKASFLFRKYKFSPAVLFMYELVI